MGALAARPDGFLPIASAFDRLFIMGMDRDYSGRPIKWPPNFGDLDKLDCLSVRIAADGTEVVQISDDEWCEVTAKGEIGDPIPDIESRKPFK